MPSTNEPGDTAPRADQPAAAPTPGVSRRRTLAVGAAALAGGAGLGVWRTHLNAVDTAVSGGEAAAFSGRITGRLEVMWSGDAGTTRTAITFDDGPDPAFTPRVLEILAERRVTATFMCMGWNAQHHGSLLDEVIAAGHEIGNHSYAHLNPVELDEQGQRDEIERTHDLLAARLGATPRFYRPPRGRLTGRAVQICNELGHDILMWSRYPGLSGVVPAATVRAEIEGTEGGDVVILHDGIGGGTFDPRAAFARALARRRTTEISALPEALDTLLERGMQLVSASELLGPRRQTNDR